MILKCESRKLNFPNIFRLVAIYNWAPAFISLMFAVLSFICVCFLEIVQKIYRDKEIYVISLIQDSQF